MKVHELNYPQNILFFLHSGPYPQRSPFWKGPRKKVPKNGVDFAWALLRGKNSPVLPDLFGRTRSRLQFVLFSRTATSCTAIIYSSFDIDSCDHDQNHLSACKMRSGRDRVLDLLIHSVPCALHSTVFSDERRIMFPIVPYKKHSVFISLQSR